MKDALEVAADWWSEELLIEEKREEFRQALLAKLREVGIEGLMARYDSKRFGRIKVDYDPDEILWDALEEAGIRLSPALFTAKGILPLKTVMCIYVNGRVIVSRGYGATFVELREGD